MMMEVIQRDGTSRIIRLHNHSNNNNLISLRINASRGDMIGCQEVCMMISGTLEG